jgi:hypothetical protein
MTHGIAIVRIGPATLLGDTGFVRQGAEYSLRVTQGLPPTALLLHAQAVNGGLEMRFTDASLAPGVHEIDVRVSRADSRVVEAAHALVRAQSARITKDGSVSTNSRVDGGALKGLMLALGYSAEDADRG